MAIARDLLKAKSSNEIISVLPNATVLDAMRVMAEHNVGAVIVLDAEGSVQGILSERDVVRKVDVLGRQCNATIVAEIMTTKVLYVEATQPVEECLYLMNEKNIRHLPVMEGGKLAGIISVRDTMHTVLSEQEFMIAQLEHYITGGKA